MVLQGFVLTETLEAKGGKAAPKTAQKAPAKPTAKKPSAKKSSGGQKATAAKKPVKKGSASAKAKKPTNASTKAAKPKSLKKGAAPKKTLKPAKGSKSPSAKPHAKKPTPKSLKSHTGQASKSKINKALLGTKKNEAVFWSGIRGRDKAAEKWAKKNGGKTLEMKLRESGTKLPVYNKNNRSSVKAWDNASRSFAKGAKGNVRVLHNKSVGTSSVWRRIEYPALKNNPNVNRIIAVNPKSKTETILWQR